MGTRVGALFRTRETVLCDTRADSAMSRIVAGPDGPLRVAVGSISTSGSINGSLSSDAVIRLHAPAPMISGPGTNRASGRARFGERASQVRPAAERIPLIHEPPWRNPGIWPDSGSPTNPGDSPRTERS